MEIISLEPKQPYERVGYIFNMSKVIPNTDSISSVAFIIYNDDTDVDANPTDLGATMLYATDFDGFDVECDAQAGTSGVNYRIRGRIQCNSGLRFEVEGRFRVTEI